MTDPLNQLAREAGRMTASERSAKDNAVLAAAHAQAQFNAAKQPLSAKAISGRNSSPLTTSMNWFRGSWCLGLSSALSVVAAVLIGHTVFQQPEPEKTPVQISAAPAPADTPRVLNDMPPVSNDTPVVAAKPAPAASSSPLSLKESKVRAPNTPPTRSEPIAKAPAPVAAEASAEKMRSLEKSPASAANAPESIAKPDVPAAATPPVAGDQALPRQQSMTAAAPPAAAPAAAPAAPAVASAARAKSNADTAAAGLARANTAGATEATLPATLSQCIAELSDLPADFRNRSNTQWLRIAEHCRRQHLEYQWPESLGPVQDLTVK